MKGIALAMEVQDVKSLAINLSLFKIGWLAVVFSAAAGVAVIGTATVALVVSVHLLRAQRRAREATLLLIAAIVGLFWESFLVQMNVLSYSQGGASLVLAPYWIVSMWVLFATTLNIGMKWLRKNVLLTSMAGAICGPLSFVAGEQLGAVFLGTNAIPVIALGWRCCSPPCRILRRALAATTNRHW